MACCPALYLLGSEVLHALLVPAPRSDVKHLPCLFPVSTGSGLPGCEHQPIPFVAKRPPARPLPNTYIGMDTVLGVVADDSIHV